MLSYDALYGILIKAGYVSKYVVERKCLKVAMLLLKRFN